MNAAALDMIEPVMEDLLQYLIEAKGGDGNGVAALWKNGRMESEKGVRKVRSVLQILKLFRSEGASWLLFHTRLATCGEVSKALCHPFVENDFLLAHNGHDAVFAELGQALSLSDSACIARVWGRLDLPIRELQRRKGVFMGFAKEDPFIVKGDPHSDLVALWDSKKRAVLFASELPPGMPFMTKVGQVALVGEGEIFDAMDDGFEDLVKGLEEWKKKHRVATISSDLQKMYQMYS
jgi:hypothetical protein